MANTATQAAAPAAPVAPVAAAVATIGGKPVADVESTLMQIGFESFKAERMMAQGKQALDVLDANLEHWVRGLPYVEFMQVRDIYITGGVDAGGTADGVQKQWERQINRLVSTFSFVRPKSESKDAQRKAEQKAKEIEALAQFGEGELLEQKADLLAKGDNKSLAAAKKINAELARRNADALDKEAAGRKMLLEGIVKRAKELAKAGTADADAKLTAAMLALS